MWGIVSAWENKDYSTTILQLYDNSNNLLLFFYQVGQMITYNYIGFSSNGTSKTYEYEVFFGEVACCKEVNNNYLASYCRFVYLSTS